MPKLLLSFGLLLAISGLIGFQALSRMEESNANFDNLYQKHLLGLDETASLRKAKLSCGRYVRNAIIDIHDQERIAQSEKSFENNVAEFNTLLADVGKLLVSQEGQAKLELIRSMAPQWEQRNREIFALAKQGNTAAAIETLRSNEDF